MVHLVPRQPVQQIKFVSLETVWQKLHKAVLVEFQMVLDLVTHFVLTLLVTTDPSEHLPHVLVTKPVAMVHVVGVEVVVQRALIQSLEASMSAHVDVLPRDK